jgi:glycosyltransferase involved in cell wall biosynthesis
MNKVFFLIRSLSVGGSERQLVTLAAGLHRRGYEVKVIVFTAGGMLESDLRALNVPILNLGRGGYKDLPAVFLKLRKILASESPDVLYSFLPASNIWSGLMKILTPSLTVVWGIRASIDALPKGWWAWINTRVEVWLARRVNWIIANSRAGSLYIEKRGYPKNRISVIPNGIDLEHFRPMPNDSLRTQWRISLSQMLIGMIGRLETLKDHPTFFQAISLISQSRDDLRFVCVGDGEDSFAAGLKEQARGLNLDRVLIWAGEMKDMPAVYNSLDLLVLTSSAEGFPNVIAEAMACGVPCVVTDAGDASIIVGDVGEVVPPKKPAALKDGLLSMLQRISEDPSFKQSVRQRIIENFSVDALIERTSQTLENLTNKG